MGRLSSYFHQASFAYARAASTNVMFFSFKECLASGIMQHFRDQIPDWKSYIIPELVKMQKEDSFGPLKDLYTTLCCYLRNNNSIADSARELNMHRNTIVYRLQKIRSTLQVDIDDPLMRTYLFNAVLMLRTENV